MLEDLSHRKIFLKGTDDLIPLICAFEFVYQSDRVLFENVAQENTRISLVYLTILFCLDKIIKGVLYVFQRRL